MIAPPLPHPTQVRSACERCRKQKLKCSRQQGIGSGEPCARCSRLGFLCEAGSQRKIGRPGKATTVTASAAAAAASTTSPPAPTQAPTPNSSTTSSAVPSPVDVFTSEESSPAAVLPGLAANGADSDPFLGSFGQDQSWQHVFGEHLLGDSLPLAQTQLPTLPGCMNVAQELPRQFAKPSGSTFESLSSVNSNLHNVMQCLRDSWPISGMCERPSMEGLPEFFIFQITIQVLQEYLTTLKTIHRLVGINKPNFPPGTRSVPSGNWRTTSGKESNTRSGPKLDIATTLLIVSCYVQLIHVCENLLNMFEIFFRFTMGETLINEGLTFSDVLISDFTTQVSMFADMVRHILLQINVVIGIPGSSRRNTVWIGLLTEPHDQEVLKRELEKESQHEWSERPKKLIAGIERLKDTLEEASMLTQF